MKYKALIVDVDGTLIPNRRNGMPSPRVTQAIQKASKLLHVGVATGRPYSILSHIFEHLKLSGPSIITGGSRVIDTNTQEVLWEQTILIEDLGKIRKIIAPYKNMHSLVNDNGQDFDFTKEYNPQKPLEMAFTNLSQPFAEKLLGKLSVIPTISVHMLRSWQEGLFDLLLNHAAATKQHGIFEIAKILGINTHEIIGIGDGGNDLPLLMACGLKIAMGNGSSDLKAIADYIAPPVGEDGVADAIEKFVLN